MKGGAILISAGILFVAEVFDVLTSESSYRKQLVLDEAVKEIEPNAGSQFDPEVVKALKSCVKDFGFTV